MLCMFSLQTLNEDNGDQLYSYYRFIDHHENASRKIKLQRPWLHQNYYMREGSAIKRLPARYIGQSSQTKDTSDMQWGL
jgi:hypothetical protein